MKTTKLFASLLLFISVCTVAQPRFKEKKEQIKSLKVAYITDELDLSTDEAAKFWPLYNAYDDKQKELRKEKLRSYLDRLDRNAIAKMDEKEALNLISQMENTEEELYQLRKKFNTNLKSALPSKKIILLKKAEEGFNRKLLRQYRDKGKQ